MISTGSSSTYNAIEAPFIVKRGSYYYLYVSWDACCQGAAVRLGINHLGYDSDAWPYAH